MATLDTKAHLEIILRASLQYHRRSPRDSDGTLDGTESEDCTESEDDIQISTKTKDGTPREDRIYPMI